MAKIDQELVDSVRIRLMGGMLTNALISSTYCVMCCERVLPNYYAFSRATGARTYQIFRDIVDNLWRMLEDERGFNHRKLDAERLSAVDFVLDDQKHELAPSAANAVAIADIIYRNFPNCSLENAEECREFVLHDIVRFLMGTALNINLRFKDVPAYIFSGELWTHEISLHKNIVAILDGGGDIEEKVRAVKHKVLQESLSNIGVVNERKAHGVKRQ